MLKAYPPRSLAHLSLLDLASPKQTRDSYARAPARELSGPWLRTEDRFRDKLKANPKSKPRTKFQSKNKIATSYSAPPKQQGQGNKWPSDDKDGSGSSKFPKGHGGPSHQP